MKVLVIPEVYEYLDNLVTILYEKDYFGFEDFAIDYVDGLLNEILMTLPVRLHKPAPKHFEKYGKNMYYAIFEKNKRTSWYVFFTKYYEYEETVYLVRYITNNHITAQYL